MGDSLLATPETSQSLVDLVEALGIIDVKYTIESLLSVLSGETEERCLSFIEKVISFEVSPAVTGILKIIKTAPIDPLKRLIGIDGFLDTITNHTELQAVVAALKEKGIESDELSLWTKRVLSKAGLEFRLENKEVLRCKIREKFSFLEQFSISEDACSMAGAGSSASFETINITETIRQFLSAETINDKLKADWEGVLQAPDGLRLIKDVVLDMEKESMIIRADRILYETKKGESLYTLLAQDPLLAEWLVGTILQNIGTSEIPIYTITLSEPCVFYRLLQGLEETSLLKRQYKKQTADLLSKPGAVPYWLGHLKRDGQYETDGSILSILLTSFSDANPLYQYETFCDVLKNLRKNDDNIVIVHSFLEELAKWAKKLNCWPTYFSLTTMLPYNLLTKDIAEEVFASKSLYLDKSNHFFRDFSEAIQKSTKPVK